MPGSSILRVAVASCGEIFTHFNMTEHVVMPTTYADMHLCISLSSYEKDFPVSLPVAYLVTWTDRVCS